MGAVGVIVSVDFGVVDGRDAFGLHIFHCGSAENAAVNGIATGLPVNVL
jgi:hypothetical protein